MAGQGPPLPDHPELRAVAEAMEAAGLSGEICDEKFRLVFISSEEARIVGVAPSDVGRFYGKGLPRRQLEDAEYWATTDDSSRDWWKLNAPIIRSCLEPDDPAFDDVFGPLSSVAARVEPLDQIPRAWRSTHQFPNHEALRTSWLGDVTFFDLRINGDDGAFLGIMRLSLGDVRQSLLLRLARGDQRMYERMNAAASPARRSAAILFADLRASGEISRRLSSRAYFDLVRALTDLIDGEVIAQGGIVGKHAGDGASALFLSEQLGHSESEAASAAIRAARNIRDRGAELPAGGQATQVSVGVHWGAQLMTGQVATGGRLEVTALGDEMNEAARIQEVATGGTVLASKQLLERLEAAEALELGLDLDRLVYTTLAELPTAGEKALRDAGGVAVTSV
jgi:class 3 adenylate cyclase